MPEIDKIVRLIRILQWLSAPVKITVNDVQNRFRELGHTVDKRAIQRDFQTLLDAGLPLIDETTGRGREVAWSLLNTGRGNFPLLLLPDEYAAAMMLKNAMPVFKGTPVERDLERGLQKLDQFTDVSQFPEDSMDFFDTLQPGLVDYSDTKIYGNMLKDITGAIRRHRLCKVLYQSAVESRPKTFHVEPCRLLTYRGALYIQVYNTKVGHFFFLAVHRLKKWEMTDIEFAKHTPEEIKAAMRDRMGLFDGPLEKVTLEFLKAIVPHIEHRHWHSSQQEKRLANGNLRLSMTVAISPELKSWILSWSSHVTVQAPESLRSSIQEEIERMHKIYRK